MDAQRWQQVQDSFEAAQLLEGAERDSYLNTLPAEVSREVSALLAADSEAAGFLEQPYHTWPQEGTRIGPYTIQSLVARGGMGEVYKARRESDFTQQVAIKVLGPMFAVHDAERLFARERQILAQLSHPHIVRLLDGGTSEGRQYLVMEWIDGQPLDEWARTASLDDRLRIFEEICDAVQAAHQSLVVHCDLKPSNILVTENGQLKLLDFGIAKLADLAGGLPAPARTMLRALTLSYASPEQARAFQPGTPSDVYSLGLILYELVTGKLAQPVEGLPLDEAIAAIASKDPPRVAGIPRDLDAVIRKAAAKEPSRRYAGARELGEDVKRFRLGYPVAAQPPSARYRALKFIRRNRPAVFAGTLGAIAAIAALAAFSVQYRATHHQRGVAERRFGAARQLAQMLSMEAPQRLSAIPGTIDTRRWMAEQATRYLEQLAADAGNDSAFALDVARGYRQLAFQQFNPNTPNLNDPKAALLSLQRGAALLDKLNSTDRDVLAELVQNHIERPYLALRMPAEAIRAEDTAAAIATRLSKTGANPDLDLLARVWFRQASNDNRSVSERLDLWSKLERYYRRRLDEKPDDPNRLRNLALVFKTVSSLYSYSKDYEKALEHDHKALALDEQRQKLNPDDATIPMDLSFDYGRLGQDLAYAGRVEEGYSYLSKAVAIRRRLASMDPQNKFVRERLAWMLGEMGSVLLPLRTSEAKEALREAIAIREQIQAFGVGSRSMPDLHVLLATAAEKAHNTTEACLHWRHAHRYMPQRPEGLDSILPVATIREKAALCGAH